MDLQTVLMTIIAGAAVFTILNFILKWRLNPLETRMDGFEKRMDGLEKRMDGIEANQVRMETKLDKLIDAKPA